MHQQMRDIKGIASKIGHSGFYSTVMCNLSWLGTRRVLLLGQVPQDRSGLADKVFMMKFRAIMLYIICEKLFGNVA